MDKSKKEDKKPVWLKTVGVGIGGALVVGLIALAFLWPAKTAQPHNLPIAITGDNEQQVSMIKAALSQNNDGKIELVAVDDRSGAVQKIENREVYGALVLNMARPEVLSASANGPAANGVITSIGSVLAESLSKAATSATTAGQQTPPVTITTTDIVPVYSKTFDIAQLAMPLVFGGMIGAVMIVALVAGRWQRLIALAVYAVSAANVLYLILHSWFDVLPADYWAVTGAFAFGIFATSAFITAAYVLGGVRGLAAAALLNLFVANPMSGNAIPPSFLPEPWGVVGQGLTVGAAGTLLRAAVYFPVAGVLTAPIIVLTVWSVLSGVILAVRDRERLSH